jgi:threonine synthase
MMTGSTSLACAQRSLRDTTQEYPLLPALTEGCPATSDSAMQFPLEIAFDYDQIDRQIFEQDPLPGLDRWAPLLPPLAPGLSMAEGGTPLLPNESLAKWAGVTTPFLLKDETRNPTWSHKDRLNLCTMSAAIASGAPGVVVSSSGNHGAAAAAYAARAGLPCIVLTTDDAPPAVQSFLLAYGAAAVGVPAAARWPLLREIVARLGYHPVSNQTPFHTGHPYGPKGYKTIAYELYLQLGDRVPAAVLIPTGYGELLFGVWKGFRELQQLGVTAVTPRMIACEPAARAPLSRALAEGRFAVEVAPEHTDASGIAVRVNGYRGVLAVQESDGTALRIPDAALVEAQGAMARTGLWTELSGAAGLAGLRQMTATGETFDGPVVAVVTSSGFKDVGVGNHTVPMTAPEWPAVAEVLRSRYGISA